MTTKRWPPKYLRATQRAARHIAALVAAERDSADCSAPLHEARCSGEEFELMLALGQLAADLARERYGEQAEAEMQRHALAAIDYAQHHAEAEAE